MVKRTKSKAESASRLIKDLSEELASLSEAEREGYSFYEAFYMLQWVEDPEILMRVWRWLHREYGENPIAAAVELDDYLSEWFKGRYGIEINAWGDRLSQESGHQADLSSGPVWIYEPFIRDIGPVVAEGGVVRLIEGVDSRSLWIDIRSELLPEELKNQIVQYLNKLLPAPLKLRLFDPEAVKDELVRVHALFDLSLRPSWQTSVVTVPEAVSEIVQKGEEDARTRSPRRARIVPKKKSLDEDPEKIVMGIVLVPDEVDAQGDIYSEEEVRKAAHYWMEVSQGQFAYLHSGVDGQFVGPSDITVLESAVALTDFEYEGEQIKKGTWYISARVNNDEYWQEIERGNITGFSIGAWAREVPV